MVQKKKPKTKKAPPSPPTTIGWREWAALPDLDIARIKAKIDTGARTSSLHAYDVEIYKEVVPDGEIEMVRFKVHPFQRSSKETIVAAAPMIDQRWVKSSGGHQTLRPVVKTTLVLAGRSVSIELTLTNRDTMGFRMLVGRQGMRKNFVVDPARSYVGGTHNPKKEVSS